MTETKTEKKTVKKVAKVEVEKTNENKFAVIKIAGTQLKVVEGKEYEIRKIDGKKGDVIELTDVLLISDGDKTTLGTPVIEGAKVVLEITSQKKGEKIEGFKYSAKARYRKHFGARESITKVLVKKI
jgi:large subunit ribosomal protein L21